VSPRYEVEKGAAFDTAAHVRLRGISGNSCALRPRVFGHQTCAYRPPLRFRLFEAKISCVGGFSIAQRAAVECAIRARRPPCITAGRSAQKTERGLSYVVRDADIRNCAGSPFETQISSRSVVGMARYAFDGGSRGPEAAGIRLGFRFGCAVGFLDVVVGPQSPH
jgi:hypothetical protein